MLFRSAFNLVTYPRTDARVLSTAAAKEIYKNISGLRNYEHTAEIAQHIIEQLGAHILKLRQVK